MQLDVEGISVPLNPDAPGVPFSFAWDTDPPQAFNLESARRNGASICPNEFKALTVAIRAGWKGATKF